MNLLVIGINYAPEVTGISKYTTEMCEYLASKGHKVQVVTGYPYYPFGVDFSSWYARSKGLLFCREKINGVDVRRVNLFKPKSPGTLKRIFHEISFLTLAFIRLIFCLQSYEMIVCISPPLLLGLVAYLVSKLRGVPFVFHVQDMQPDAAVELGMIKEGALTSFLYAVEKFIYQKARYVFTISEGMREKIINKGVSKDKVKIFYNWADVGTLIPKPKDNPFARKHGLNGEFVVLHAGNMGEKQDMHTIMETAGLMRDDLSVRFLIIGRGIKRGYVEWYIEEHALRNVLLLDVQPNEVVNDMYACADVALVMQSKKVRDIVLPSKMLAPSSVGKPLILAAVDDCDAAKTVKAHDFGLLIPAEEPQALATAIAQLKSGKNLAERLGNNGRRFMEVERNKEKIIDQFMVDVSSN